jgi:hypothetical protein
MIACSRRGAFGASSISTATSRDEVRTVAAAAVRPDHRDAPALVAAQRSFS